MGLSELKSKTVVFFNDSVRPLLAKPESMFGLHRSTVKGIILEIKNVLELMTLSAAFTAAAIVTESVALKYIGTFVLLLSNTYLFLIFPFILFDTSNKGSGWKNMTYTLFKVAAYMTYNFYSLEWVSSIVRSVLK